MDVDTMAMDVDGTEIPASEVTEPSENGVQSEKNDEQLELDSVPNNNDESDQQGSSGSTENGVEVPESMKPVVRLERITDVSKFLAKWKCELLAERKRLRDAFYERLRKEKDNAKTSPAPENEKRSPSPEVVPIPEESGPEDLPFEDCPDMWLNLLTKSATEKKKSIEPVIGTLKLKKRGPKKQLDPDFDLNDVNDDGDDSDDSLTSLPLPPPVSMPSEAEGPQPPAPILMSGPTIARNADEFRHSLFGGGGGDQPQPPTAVIRHSQPIVIRRPILPKTAASLPTLPQVHVISQAQVSAAGLQTKTLLLPTSQPNQFAKFTLVPVPPVEKPPEVVKRTDEELRKEHGITKRVKVNLERLKLPQRTLDDYERQYKSKSYKDLYLQSIDLSREIFPSIPPFKRKLNSWELARASKVRVKVTRLDPERAFRRLLKEARERDVEGHYRRRFFCPPYKLAVNAFHESFFEPEMPSLPSSIEDDFEALPDFDCYEIFEPEVVLKCSDVGPQPPRRIAPLPLLPRVPLPRQPVPPAQRFIRLQAAPVSTAPGHIVIGNGLRPVTAPAPSHLATNFVPLCGPSQSTFQRVVSYRPLGFVQRVQPIGPPPPLRFAPLVPFNATSFPTPLPPKPDVVCLSSSDE